MKDALIRQDDFCEIITDQFEAETGIKKGQRVYIAGHRALPENEEDPYTQRIKFFVHLVVDKLIVPGLYVMDPRSLRKVSGKEQKKLHGWLKAQFTDEVPPDGSAIN